MFELISGFTEETLIKYDNPNKKYKASIKKVVITINKTTYTGMILTLTVQPIIPVNSGGRKVLIPDETQQYDVNILITENPYSVFFVENNKNKKFKINSRFLKTKFNIRNIRKIIDELTEEKRIQLTKEAIAQLTEERNQLTKGAIEQFITEAIEQLTEEAIAQLTEEDRTQLTEEKRTQLTEEKRTQLTDEIHKLIAYLKTLGVMDIAPFLHLKNIINFWIIQMNNIIKDKKKKKRFMKYINKNNHIPMFNLE